MQKPSRGTIEKASISTRLVWALVLLLAGISGMTFYVFLNLQQNQKDVGMLRKLGDEQIRMGKILSLLHFYEAQPFADNPSEHAFTDSAREEIRRLMGKGIFNSFSEAEIESLNSLWAYSKDRTASSTDSQKTKELQQKWLSFSGELEKLLSSPKLSTASLLNLSRRGDEILSGFADLEAILIEDSYLTNKHIGNISLLSMALGILFAFFIYVTVLQPIALTVKRLNLAENKYRSIYESSPNGIAILNLKQELIEINPAGLKALGYSQPSEVIGRKSIDFLVADQRKRAEQLTAELFKKKFLEDIRVKVRTGDGRERIFSFNSRLLDDGEREGLILVNFQDATEQFRQEAESARYTYKLEHLIDIKSRQINFFESRYKKLFESILDGLVILDAQFRLIQANPAFVTLLGERRKRRLKGTNVKTLFADNKHLIELLEKTVKENRLFEEEIEISPSQDQRSIFSVEAQPIFYEGNTHRHYLLIFHDITRRKLFEEEAKRLEQQLQQAQKMEAIGQLAGGIAHDFNNLLTGIKGFSEFGILKSGTNTTLKEYFERIIRAADRAAELTQRLLAFGRRQNLKFQSLNLNEVIDEAVKFVRRVIGEHIELIVHLMPEAAIIKADPVSLHQIITNLCINARDAMPGGGQLVISTATAKFDSEYCRTHAWAREGDYILLQISDTGMGMSREVQDKIFEPFFTTKSVGKGTGLGLSMVYGLVKQHSGFITVYSEENKGTVFNLYFPATEGLPDKQKQHIAPSRLYGDETILVAEDDELVAKLIAETLEEYGYRVILASDGESALSSFQKYAEAIDLVIADTVMPKFGGFELLEQIEASHPEKSFLLISGYSPAAFNKTIFQKEKFEFLNKPFGPPDLVERVRILLDTKKAPHMAP